MTDEELIKRLRGEYRIKITDGLGPAGGDEPNNPNEHVRHFPTVPIQLAAADAIARLTFDNTILGEIVRERDVTIANLVHERDAALADAARLREALTECVAVLGSDGMNGVMTISTLHGCPYSGPFVNLDRARAALKEPG